LFNKEDSTAKLSLNSGRSAKALRNSRDSEPPNPELDDLEYTWKVHTSTDLG
jgi:hypothetical protein